MQHELDLVLRNEPHMYDTPAGERLATEARLKLDLWLNLGPFIDFDTTPPLI